MQRRTLLLGVSTLVSVAAIVALAMGATTLAAGIIVVMAFGIQVVLIFAYSQIRAEGATQRSNIASFRKKTDAQLTELTASLRSEIHGRAGALRRLERRNHDDTVRLLSQITDRLQKDHTAVLAKLEANETGHRRLRDQLQQVAGDLDTVVEESSTAARAEIHHSCNSILEAQSISNARLAAWNDASREILEAVEFATADSLRLVRGIAESQLSISDALERSNESMLSRDALVEQRLSDWTETVNNQIEACLRRMQSLSSSMREMIASGNTQLSHLSSTVEQFNAEAMVERAHGVDRTAEMENALRAGVSGIKSLLQSEFRSLQLRTDSAVDAAEDVANSVAVEFEALKTRQDKQTAKLITAMYAETQQTEALLQLLSKVQPRWIMPSLGRWALDAKAMLHLCQIVEDSRPRRVLELGSGTSTVWLGYLAESIGATVVSIENDNVFKIRTEQLLQRHGLSNVVTVIEAPLETVQIDGRAYSWYSPGAFEGIREVDLLLVDGPVGTTNRWARYPAVPLLRPVLAENSLVALDDSDRPDESDCLRAWTERYPLKSLNHDVSRLSVMQYQGK